MTCHWTVALARDMGREQAVPPARSNRIYDIMMGPDGANQQWQAWGDCCVGGTVSIIIFHSIPFIVNKYNISFKARHPLESEESDRHERPSPTFHPICFYCEWTVVRTNLITLVLSISAQKLQCKWLLYPQLHVLFAQLRGSEVIWKLLTLVNIIIVWECLCINFLKKR